MVYIYILVYSFGKTRETDHLSGITRSLVCDERPRSRDDLTERVHGHVSTEHVPHVLQDPHQCPRLVLRSSIRSSECAGAMVDTVIRYWVSIGCLPAY